MTTIKRVLIGAIEMDENGGTGVRLTLQKYDSDDGENTIKYHRFPFQNGLTDDGVVAQNLLRRSRGGEPMGAKEEANLRRYVSTSESSVPVNAHLIQMGWPALDNAQIAQIEALRIVACGGTTDLPSKIAAGAANALGDLVSEVSAQRAADLTEMVARAQSAEEAVAAHLAAKQALEAQVKALTAELAEARTVPAI